MKARNEALRNQIKNSTWAELKMRFLGSSRHQQIFALNPSGGYDFFLICMIRVMPGKCASPDLINYRCYHSSGVMIKLFLQKPTKQNRKQNRNPTAVLERIQSLRWVGRWGARRRKPMFEKKLLPASLYPSKTTTIQTRRHDIISWKRNPDCSIL